jgi:hypothetical protein
MRHGLNPRPSGRGARQAKYAVYRDGVPDEIVFFGVTGD